MTEFEEYKRFTDFIGEIVNERYFTAEKPSFAVEKDCGNKNAVGAVVCALVLFGANAVLFGKLPRDAKKYCFAGSFTVSDAPRATVRFCGTDGEKRCFAFTFPPETLGTVFSE